MAASDLYTLDSYEMNNMLIHDDQFTVVKLVLEYVTDGATWVNTMLTCKLVKDAFYGQELKKRVFKELFTLVPVSFVKVLFLGGGLTSHKPLRDLGEWKALVSRIKNGRSDFLMEVWKEMLDNFDRFVPEEHSFYLAPLYMFCKQDALLWERLWSYLWNYFWNIKQADCLQSEGADQQEKYVVVWRLSVLISTLVEQCRVRMRREEVPTYMVRMGESSHFLRNLENSHFVRTPAAKKVYMALAEWHLHVKQTYHAGKVIQVGKRGGRFIVREDGRQQRLKRKRVD